MKNGKSYTKWLLLCPSCNIAEWKFSNTLSGKKFPCKICYDRSMRKTDSGPAIKRAYISLKANAKTRNLEVAITEEQFYQIAAQDCFYCGHPPTERRAPKEWQLPAMLNGVDRIDNSMGYILENCYPCCEQCNWAKRDLSVSEWYSWIDRIVEKRNNG